MYNRKWNVNFRLEEKVSTITNHEVRQTLDMLITERNKFKDLLMGKKCKCPKKTAMNFDDRKCRVCRLLELEELIKKGEKIISSGDLNNIHPEGQDLIEDAILQILPKGQDLIERAELPTM